MPTRITRVDTAGPAAMKLKVEGSLYLEDAEMLEKMCRDIQQQAPHGMTLDLASLSFLDSDGAEFVQTVRCRFSTRFR